ncbi:uncharacterized protein LOC141712322 [Apium graveolens]|uniref:uncharacterized protein LOC141712322 n=1 Tax=Apium graveolens TaxID=4045 RepID=UPI003D7ADFFF
MLADEKRGGREHPRRCLYGFTDTITDCGLVDLGFVGEKYTWERSRGIENWVQERLDRGLANQEWCNIFPAAEVRVLEIATSDHLPLYLQLNKQVYVPRNKRFKFENVWLREKECFWLVKNSWESMEGKHIIDKISYCCFRLEEWGGGTSREFKRKLIECREKLRRLRSRRDVMGIQDYNAMRWEYLNLLERKEIYWRQRAKQFWLQEGDQNTRFFHRYASMRKNSNSFRRIKNENGEWKDTP